MKSYVRCKACGFVMEAGKLRDKCPACGVAAKMFEPYMPDISEARKRILDLDLHPIVVHLPQAFAQTLVVISALAWIFPRWQPILSDTIRVLSWGLPFVVLGAFLSGLLDGKIRFRRVTTPILKRKLFWGSLFLVFSLALLFAGQSASPSASQFIPIMFCLSVGCMVCSGILGSLGASLLGAKFPG